MRSPRAARPAAKFLILLAFGAFSPLSDGEAATRCRSGEILRVSLGVCVPKAENLAIVAKHGTRKHEPADAEADPPRAPAPKPVRHDAENSDRAEQEAVETAVGEAPARIEQPSAASSSSASALLKPFGALFVGAFHSTLSTGMSAFR